MLKLLLTSAILPGVVLAGVYGDTPDAKHAWAVHDPNRPNPAKVTAADTAGGPPSDAVVLFDGTKASLERNWCDEKGGPTKWEYSEAERSFGLARQCPKGKFSTGAGAIFTREPFGDCQLHLEFKYPADIAGEGQMRGNSGVFPMGCYEIQLLESYDTDPARMANPNYADGQCGAVYAETPPLVNANRRPGAWQTFDIVFHQPVWEGLRLVHPGSMTVFHNGVLVQDHWEMEGLTTHRKRKPLAPHATKLPLKIQDHGCPISFRNVWYRPLASRWANKTHSALTADENAVMALRRETAAKIFAKIADPKAATADNVRALAEVISYANETPYSEAFEAALEAYRAAAHDPKDVETVNWTLDILYRNRVLTVDKKIIIK